MNTLEVLTAIKADIRAYGVSMLNEAEHAAEIGADELRFAAVTAAAAVEVAIRIINKHAKKL